MSKYTALLLLAIGLTIGCSKGEQEASSEYQATASAAAPAAMPSDSMAAGHEAAPNMAKLVSNVTELPRQVVKTGTLTVQVDSVDKAEKQAHAIVDAAAGRVDKVSSSDLAGPNPTIEMALRVPVGSFDNVVGRLEGLGTRMAKTVSVDDVTERIVDMDARLKTMLAQEQALRNMLAQTRRLADSLAVNRDITELREQIESMNAQRKSLAGQAAYSTVTLTLSQKANAATVTATDPNWFQTSWAGAWSAATNVFRNFVGVLLWLLVFSPAWIAGLLFVRWAIRVGRRPEARGV